MSEITLLRRAIEEEDRLGYVTWDTRRLLHNYGYGPAEILSALNQLRRPA